MVEFKAVINDGKDGKSYQVPVTGHHANSLIGKKIGDVVDGIFVGSARIQADDHWWQRQGRLPDEEGPAGREEATRSC